jgi:hypothetical protein
MLALIFAASAAAAGFIWACSDVTTTQSDAVPNKNKP